MPHMPRKAVIAVAAVIDVVMQEHGKPISAKTLASRHGLPPRHLEPVLQALVRCGILKGIRGPRGGYELARDRRRVTANDILQAAGTVEESEEPQSGSELVTKVVLPAVAAAEREVGGALSRINVEDLARDAPAAPEGEPGARTAGARRSDQRGGISTAAFTIWTLSARFPLIPIKSKFARFAGSLAADRPADRG